MITLLPYGIKNGELVKIDTVSSGLRCDCFCPSCGSALVAKKGKLKTHHFAHYQEGNCAGAIETALHLAAKRILQERKKIRLPDLLEFIGEPFYDYVTLQKSQIIKFEDVKSEVRWNDIVVDIVGYFNNQPLLIEIGVTHFIDTSKEQKIIEYGVSCIEIDLSFLENGFSEKELEKAVINDTSNKSWIFHRKHEKLLTEFLARNQKKLQDRRIVESHMIQMKINTDNQIVNLKKQGFQIIEIDQDGKRLCPKLIQQNAYNFRENEITIALRKGIAWNGKIYGLNNNDRFIYLGSEKKVIIPYSLADDLPLYMFDDFKNTFGQLTRIAWNSDVDIETCEKCEYLDSIIKGEFSEIISCKFRKSKR